MQQLLNELLIALASFDCRRSVSLLCEAVAEYRQTHDIRDFVWAQKTFATGLPEREPDDDRKVADFIGQAAAFRGQQGPLGTRKLNQAHASNGCNLSSR